MSFALHALVLAGGGGTRLWPLSRRSRPKQFLREFSGSPLIADTVTRLAPLVPAARTWVVAGAAHDAGVREALPALPAAHLVREPAARNTAPAIALGVSAILLEDPDAVIAVLPSDHHIGKPDRFRAALEAAARVAVERGLLVTLGIVPDRPATGYGYIERGPALDAFAFEVARFIEKPTAARAVELVTAGNLWNAGVFVFRGKDFLEHLDRFLPELAKGLAEWRAAAPGARDAIARRVFETAPSISVDYAVMEKSDRVAVVPAPDVDWDDIGSFRSLARVLALARGNEELRWARELSRNLLVSFLGYLVAGAFLSMAYYDVFLCLVALTAPLLEVVTQASRRKAEITEAQPFIPAHRIATAD